MSAIEATIAVLRSPDFNFDIGNEDNCINGAFYKAHPNAKKHTAGLTLLGLPDKAKTYDDKYVKLFQPPGWDRGVVRTADEAIVTLERFAKTGEVKW